MQPLRQRIKFEAHSIEGTHGEFGAELYEVVNINLADVYARLWAALNANLSPEVETARLMIFYLESRIPGTSIDDLSPISKAYDYEYDVVGESYEVDRSGAFCIRAEMAESPSYANLIGTTAHALLGELRAQDIR